MTTRSRVCCGLLALGAAVAALATGRPALDDAKADEPLPPDLKFVANCGAAFVSARAADVTGLEQLKLLPAPLRRQLDDGRAAAEAALGLKARDVERVTVLFAGARGAAVLVRTARPYDREAFLRAAFRDAKPTDAKHRGLPFYTAPGSHVAVHPVSDTLLLFGDAAAVPFLIDRAGDFKPGPYAGAARLAAGKHHVVAAFTPRDAVTFAGGLGGRKDAKEEDAEKAFREMLDNVKPAGLPYKPLFLARTVLLTLDLGDESTLGWRLAFDNDDEARDAETAVRVLFYVVREGLIPDTRRAWGITPWTEPPLAKALTDWQAALRKAPVERAFVQTQQGMRPMLLGTVRVRTDAALLKAASADAAQRADFAASSSKLKQIGIALHSFHDAYNFLPGNICDAQGKPLLSWRVAILPFLEELPLYKQFKLDEPWDSEHNKKLLAKMPKVYAPVRPLPNQPGATFYQVFVGEGAPFQTDGRPGRAGQPAVGPRIAEFTDGLSNTFFAVEGGAAVPWTRPEDLPVTPLKLPKLGGQFDGVFHALLGDGSVRRLPTTLPAETLRALITHRGGEVIDWDKIDGK
jgi:hypothetical protein